MPLTNAIGGWIRAMAVFREAMATAERRMVSDSRLETFPVFGAEDGYPPLGGLQWKPRSLLRSSGALLHASNEREDCRRRLSSIGGASMEASVAAAQLGGFFTREHARAGLGEFACEKAPATTSPRLSLVGVRGFEPPTSSSRTTRANRAALHPEIGRPANIDGGDQASKV